MAVSKERRTHMLNFAVTDTEAKALHEKMASSGFHNQSAFLRTLALNGYILKLDLPEIRELIRLLRNMTNNLNQIARRVNAGGNLYETEMDEILANQQQLWNIMKQLLTRLDGTK